MARLVEIRDSDDGDALEFVTDDGRSYSVPNPPGMTCQQHFDHFQRRMRESSEPANADVKTFTFSY